MKEQAEAFKQIQDFLRAWFCCRDPESTAAYLSDDIYFIGTGRNAMIQGIQNFQEFLYRDCEEVPLPFRMVFLHPQEQPLGADSAAVQMEILLGNKQFSWRLRASFILRVECACWRICHIHISEATNKQRRGEHYPNTLIVESLKRQRQELLNDAVAGGMMGGYLQTGFPFYFINQRMLDYLGYTSQQDFIGNIGGLLNNCVHPDERKKIEHCIVTQLAMNHEYAVEYRMQKKSGGYIWVHDIGRATTDENGKPIFISVCVDITALHTVQEDRKQLLNTIPGAVFRCRFAEGLEVLETSNGLFDMIGYTRQEFSLFGNRLTALLQPEDAVNVLPTFHAQISAGAECVYIECRLICRDSRTIWIGLRGHLFTDDANERMLFCVLTDSTDQVEERQRMRTQFERESEYATELASPNLIAKAIVNLTQDFFESCSGFDGSSFKSIPIPRCMDDVLKSVAQYAVIEEDAQAIQSLFSRENLIKSYARGETDHSFEFRCKWTNGNIIWCKTLGRTYLNPKTNQLALFIYAFNITEERLSKKLLEQVSIVSYDYLVDIDIINDRYHIATKSTTIPVSTFSGSFQEENRKYVGSRVPEPFQAEFYEELNYNTIQARLETEESYSFTVPLCIAGNLCYKKFSLSYIDKIMGHICLSCMDLTDIIEQEQRQREALLTALRAAEQASLAKSDFLSHMSHEIRTPLNAIIGMSSIAMNSIGNDQETRDCLNKIAASSRFLLSLINDILDMSRIESGKMLLKRKPFSLEQLISSTTNIIRTQAAQKNVSFKCLIRAGIGDRYVGDQMKLEQILLNVLTNAVKFTDAGGKVTFTATQSHRVKNTATLRFIVADTGIGIDPSFLSHLFDPFAQESGGSTAIYSGTGLGLAISKNMVDMMNGHISVRSIQGEGSEFTIDVKLEIAEDDPLQSEMPQFSTMNTLIVDDDSAACQSTALLLQELGIPAQWVSTGNAAIQYVQEQLRCSQHFDAILLDWNLSPLNGVEIARHLRSIPGMETAVILMTAYGCGSIEPEAIAAGVNLLIEKPLFRSSLEQAFHQILHGKFAPQPKSLPQTYRFSGQRVLLAEDHPMNTEIVIKLLKHVGVQVNAASNGLHAVELFTDSPPWYFDAILMDIRMPLMDGLTAATNIRNLSRPDAPTIPIIAMTANAFEDDVDKSKSAGINVHLAKPIEPEVLYQALYNCIYKRKEGDA